MMNPSKLATACLFGCALAACNHNEPPTTTEKPTPPSAQPATPTATAPTKHLEDPGAERGVPVSRAVAVLQPTKDGKTAGTVTFTAHGAGGLQVKTEVTGLTPGKHAYHIHQFGDCSSGDGESAGTHFHFTGSSEKPGDHIDHVTGDLGDLEAGADGTASATVTIEGGQLQGPYTLVGRSVIVHEKPNDHSQPPLGGAGGRLACGVIGVADAQAGPQKADATHGAHGARGG